jgi:site-specific recombinase XerD
MTKANKELFERFLTVDLGLSQISVHNYVGSARRMIHAIGEKPEIEEVKKYMYILYTSDFSYSYKTNTALGLEKYMRFIGKPVYFGRQKKPKPMVKETLTESEITKLIFNANNIREKAIISILAYSGLRNKELCDLKVKNFIYSQNAIRVISGKGYKDGISEVSPECTKIVLDYINEFKKSDEEYLFTTLRKGNRYKGQDLRKLVHILSKRAKLNKRVYPHLLRHSMSANMLLRGAHLVSLNKQLRHTLLETTLHYVNSIVFIDKNQYQKFAPSYL